jgi:quercetin dioxygenase-like cupin family protein
MRIQIALVFPSVSRCLPLFLVAAVLSGSVFSQVAAPAMGKGVTNKPLGEIDLRAEIEDISGRRLRARLVTMEPGAQVAAHSHKGRPTLEYVVQGNVVEIRNGVEIQHGAGDIVVATGDISHWWENRSKAPVVLLPVDVFKP